MVPMILGLGPWELAIVLLIVVLLFGGSRLAGVGKASGRAIREFKEETKGLNEDKSSNELEVKNSSENISEVNQKNSDTTKTE